jgi:hypothetical protein
MQSVPQLDEARGNALMLFSLVEWFGELKFSRDKFGTSLLDLLFTIVSVHTIIVKNSQQ